MSMKIIIGDITSIITTMRNRLWRLMFINLRMMII